MAASVNIGMRIASDSPMRTKVLIAEHNPVSRNVLHSMLSGWGYDAIPVANGIEAWSYLQSDDGPHLAILDSRLTGLDAVEICRQVRAQDGLHYAYLLLLTEKGPIEDLVGTLDAGADDYITRPFNSLELRARLQAGDRIIRLQERLVQAHERLYEQATRDSLTGMWNRTAAIQILDGEIARAVRARTPIAVIMVDLDRFKLINDAHGHLAGDVVLREAASRMSGTLRKYDSIGRYGGEEFLIVVPGCHFHDSVSVAERLREAVACQTFSIGDGSYQATCSFGLSWDSCAGPVAANRLLREADTALYAAKRQGRNRVEVFGSPATTEVPA